MRYVKQIGIILGITLAGEILNHVVPLPVPAGVYGLFIMLAALMCGAVKLESVEGTGNFLMDTMTMMFIPATVGIVECIGEVKAVLVPFLIIIGISTLLVMAVTGCTTGRRAGVQDHHGRGYTASHSGGGKLPAAGWKLRL